LEWEGEEGEVWQRRRGREVFWGSLAGQEEEGVGGCWEVGEGGVWSWEEEVVSLLWEVEGVFWMEEEGEVFSWLGEVVVF